MNISVIIPTWNEEKYIESCLRAIRSQKTQAEYEVILCDARSEDRTVDIAEKYADRIINIDTHSIGISRNTGAKKANGKYLVFVDADTVIPPNYLEKVMEKFSNDPELLGFSAGFIFSQRIEKLIFTEKIINSYLEFRDKVGLATLLGFNIGVRKEAFNAINGFRNVPLEDGEFSIRLRKLGKVRYFKDFYVVTSSRRLEEMGLLGTLRYYLEMDLATRDKRIRKLLAYNEYVKCKIDDLALQKEFERIFSSKVTSLDFDITVKDYIQKKANSLLKFMNKTTREQFVDRITEVSKSIAELKLKPKVNKIDVNHAINLIKEKIKI